MQAYAEPGAAHDAAVDEAFERLYRSYARDVYRYSLAVLRNPADAEDITQTTFLNAYRAYQRGEEPVRPKHWLIKIAHNACRTRHLRSVRRPKEVPLEESVAAMPVPGEEAPKLEELLEALGRLPFNQRAALVMRELEGRSYAEIAETLETSVPAVETLIFRARRTLRRDRSALGVLGSVQLPPSLGSLFGGGGGGAVAGGGLAVGSGLLAKAALVVAAGVVAGAIGPVVGRSVTHHRKPAAMELSPLTVGAAKRMATTTRTAGAIRVLRGPMVLVKRQGRTFVVTEGAVGMGAAVPVGQQIELQGDGTPVQSQELLGATGVEATSGPAGAESSVLPSATPATQAVTTTAKSAVTQATQVTQVTQTVTTATSTAAGALPVSTSPLPTSTVAAPLPATPPPPPLPVDTAPLTSALPPTPTVTLPDLP